MLHLIKITFTFSIKKEAEEETMEIKSYGADQALALKNTACPEDSKSYQSPFVLLNFYIKE